jgi:hypothetical protein
MIDAGRRQCMTDVTSSRGAKKLDGNSVGRTKKKKRKKRKEIEALLMRLR